MISSSLSPKAELGQNYPWGKQGKDSISARLCAGTPNTGFKIEDDQPYAEMWMGDYVGLFAHDARLNC